MTRARTPFGPALLAVLAGLVLGGCKSEFTANLAADPSDRVESLKVGLEGIELREEDGTTKSLERNQTGTPDLTQFDGDQLFTVVSGAKLKKGTYTGLRLIFTDENSRVTPISENGNGTGPEVDIDVPDEDQDFTGVDFKVKDDKDAQIIVAMDLRLSVVEGTDDKFSLVPVLRAVQSGDEAEIVGSVGTAFTGTPACSRGAAVYAFPGKDVDPEAGDVLPIATSPISGGRYDLRFLPAGDYTVAVTCDGEKQNGGGIDDAEVEFFDETHDTSLDDGETDTIDF